jgi:hypothetical protein
MRLIGNYYWEWVDARRDTRHTLLVTLVACAVGATAGAAVILSLASSPTTQPDVPSISSRPIVRDVVAFQAPQAAQDGTVVEPMPSPRAIGQNAGASAVPKTEQDATLGETTPRPAATSTVSSRDAPATQTEAEHQAEAHSQQSRSHGRIREPYLRRFAHNSSPRPFGFW